VDRESAYEKLTAAAARSAQAPAPEKPAAEKPAAEPEARAGRAAHEERSVVEQVVSSGVFKSLARSVGTQLGREITRSLFGTARRRR
jgi:hypothetical protein